jgi:DNA-binding transcriptional LysR family regulator
MDFTHVMLDSGDIRLLTTLAAHGSLVRAGRVLGITQSGATRALAALETRLRTQLFDRSRRGLEPTEVCRTIIARGGSILAAIDDLNVAVSELGGGGALCVAADPIALETVVVPAASHFMQARPRVKLSLRSGNADAVRDVRDRRAELAVAELSDLDAPEEFTIVPLRRHPVLLLSRRQHPLIRAGRVPGAADILRYPIIAPSRLPARIALSVIPGRAPGDHPFPAATIDVAGGCLTIAAGSDALATATAQVAALALNAGILVPLPFHPPWLVTNFGILSLRGRKLSAFAAVMVDLIRAADDAALATARRLVPDAEAAARGDLAVIGRLVAPALMEPGEPA